MESFPMPLFSCSYPFLLDRYAFAVAAVVTINTMIILIGVDKPTGLTDVWSLYVYGVLSLLCFLPATTVIKSAWQPTSLTLQWLVGSGVAILVVMTMFAIMGIVSGLASGMNPLALAVQGMVIGLVFATGSIIVFLPAHGGCLLLSQKLNRRKFNPAVADTFV